MLKSDYCIKYGIDIAYVKTKPDRKASKEIELEIEKYILDDDYEKIYD